MTRIDVVNELKNLLKDFNERFNHILGFLTGESGLTELDVDFVINLVCDVHSIARDKVFTGRKEEYVDARHQIRVILYNYTNLSQKKIIELTGGVNHTTILNSRRRHEDLYVTDKEYRDKFNKIVSLISKAIEKRVLEFKQLVIDKDVD